MKKIQIRQLLSNSVQIRDYIVISRRRINSHPMECVPLAIGEGNVLVHYLYDFQFDGYKIIPVKDISYIRVEKFFKSILVKESILDEFATLPLIELGGWESIIGELRTLGKNIIVQCEDLKYKGRSYNIGKIVEVNSNSLSILDFDALGIWDQTPTTISFKDITSVSFENRYVNILSKYVRDRS